MVFEVLFGCTTKKSSKCSSSKDFFLEPTKVTFKFLDMFEQKSDDMFNNVFQKELEFMLNFFIDKSKYY